MDLEHVCRTTGRAVSALTRRDVARALLSEPADEALAGLPTLRRDLVRASKPLSATFWEGTETVLASIQAGTATVGGVNEWLVATGTEPIDLIEQMFIWPEAEQAGPVALEMHALLVTHLESLVADGTIDPDRLVIGDATALAAHRQIQSDWLNTALPDGRVPRESIEEEDDDAFLAAWADAEQDAREILTSLLDEAGERPCPAPELARAAARLREELRQDRRGTAQLRAAAGVDPAALPETDEELWLTLASGVVAQRDEPPQAEFDLETLSAWTALQHPDWIAAAVTLAREGPGTSVDADRLADLIADFDFEESDEDMEDDPDEAWFDDDLGADSDAAQVISLGLHPVLHLWRQLGAVDHDDRLTHLGWWGIPASLQRAWQPTVPDDDH